MTRINGMGFVINAEIIQTLEATPDTVITLTTGAKYIVKESCDEVIDKVIAYKRKIFSGLN
ncbi:MAG: flagellar FlbD family protein [Lachnospira sp.]